MQSTKLAVIGGGPGGYAAAFKAADLGVETTLIDLEPNPGGVCLYRGCIPSKALLHAARVLSEAQEAEALGLRFGEPEVDLDKLRGWKDSVVAKLTGGLGQLSKQRKIRYLQGRARFTGPDRLEIEGKDGTRSALAFEHAILATGSRPTPMPGAKLSSSRLWDSTAALELRQVPRNLLVVGGGYIGLEMATVYAALGSAVTVVEMLPSLLPGMDKDLVSVLARRVTRACKEVLLETKVASLSEEANGLRVRLEGKGVAAKEEVFEAVLVSIGRKPNTEGLGLESTRIKPGPQGFIAVDAARRTAEPRIFAIGDIAGQPMLAHKASHEGFVAAEVLAGHKAAFEPLAIPAVVFTDPEVAWAGMTQEEAEKAGREVELARFPWAASGRAITLHRTDGLTKLVIEKGTERVLGVGIVGPNAGDLIAEGVLAVEMGARAKDLALCIHPHPTLSETVMESAEAFYGTSTHIYRPKRPAVAPEKV